MTFSNLSDQQLVISFPIMLHSSSSWCYTSLRMRNPVSVPRPPQTHSPMALLWAPWMWRIWKLAFCTCVLDASISMLIFRGKIIHFAISRGRREMLSVNELSPLGRIINIIKVGLFSQKNQRGDKYRPIYLSACHVKLPGLSLHLLSIYQIPLPQLNLQIIIICRPSLRCPHPKFII